MTSTARPAIATRVQIATISIVALVLVPSSLLARQRSSQTTQAEVQSSVAANPSSVTGNADDKKAQKKGKDAEAKPKPSRLSRWFELQIGTVSLRQRTIVNSRDVRTTSQIQDSGQFKGRFKFDPKGRYTVNAVYATGNTFTGGWNNTGIGTGDSFNHWYLKQFYVAAVPVPGVEISIGGFGVMRGESTEITTYDNDGYLVGERVSVKRPKGFFLDEFGVTSAYLGDLTSPSITNRYRRLSDEPNYVQFFATKNVTRQLTASAEYSRLTGVPTFRYAVVARTLPLVIVDMVRFEQYFRRDPQGGSGYAIYGEKAITRRFAAGLGYADIDNLAPTTNGDRYFRGKRFFETATFKLTPEFGLQFFGTQASHNTIAIPNARRLELLVTFNAVSGLQRLGIFRQ